MRKKQIKNICLCAVFAALIAACAQIAIPMPSGVSFTLQTFAVSLCAAALGVKKGTATVAVYILTGLAGAPVFASFTGSIAALFSATGGFIIGFLPLCAVCSLTHYVNRKVLKFTLILLSVALCHISGIAVFSIVTSTPFIAAFVSASLPYLLKDIVFVALGVEIGKQIKERAFIF